MRRSRPASASAPPAGARGVLAAARAELRERGSRFLAHLLPACDAGAADRLAGEVARRFPDATHHARAHRVFEPDGRLLELAHDAGEPGGTAGRPILDALAGAGVVGATLVVSRWFGGVKLGKGGLARAYGAVARSAIEAARLVPLTRWKSVEVSASYADAGGVVAAARAAGARIVGVLAAADYRVEVRVLEERLSELERALADLTTGRACTARGASFLEFVQGPVSEAEVPRNR